MPSLLSTRAGVDRMALRSTGLDAGRSVIVLSLLPLAPLQTEPGHHDRGQEERDHGARDRSTFAELTCDDCTLIRQRRHQMGGVDRAATYHRPDQLEVCEGEQ